MGSWLGTEDGTGGNVAAARVSGVENLVVFVLCGVRVPVLDSDLESSEVRVRVIAPRRGRRALEIELRGDIARKRTFHCQVLRRIVEIGAIDRGEFWPQRIALVHSNVYRLIAIQVSGLKILAANIV